MFLHKVKNHPTLDSTYWACLSDSLGGRMRYLGHALPPVQSHKQMKVQLSQGLQVMIQDEQTKNIKSIVLLWSHKKQVGYNYNTDTIDHVSYCMRKKTPGEAAFNVDMWNEGRYLLTSGSGSPALIDTQSCERFWQACGRSFSTTALIFCNIALNPKIWRTSSTTTTKLFLEETVYLHILSKLVAKALGMGCFHQPSSSPMMIFPACHHPLHCRQFAL